MNKRWRGSIIRTIALFTLGLLVAGAYTATSLQVIEADVNEKNRLDQYRLGFLRWDEHEDARRPMWITRNVVDGRPIPVCSGDYPIATLIALRIWNAALGIPAFAMSSDCDADLGEPSLARGVDRLTVSQGNQINGNAGYSGKVLRLVSCSAWGGCVAFERSAYRDPADQTKDKWHSYHGEAEVIMNPRNHPDDGDSGILIRDIAHELGHILALIDYFCHVDGRTYRHDVSQHPNRISPPARSLMNSFTLRPECNSLSDGPTGLDLDDYRVVYTPAVVTRARGEADGQVVTLKWDQSNVFVESDFEIQREVQRESGTDWVKVKTAEANAESITLTNQPSGEQRYQIVARTKALPAQAAGQEYFHGKPSAVIEVSVPLPAPTGLTVSDVTDTGATLSWTASTWAKGFEVQLDDKDVETSLGASAMSYRFTGLTAGQAHKLSVQATRDGLTSAFTTLTLLKPPKQITRGTTTQTSVRFTWTADGSATGADVRVGAGGTVRTADSKQAHRFPGLSAGRQYTFYIRSKNAQGPSAWRTVRASTSSPTLPPRPRPEKPVPEVTTEETDRETVGYDWRPFGDYPGWAMPDVPGTCYYLLYQQDRYKLAEFETPYTFDVSKWEWVLDPENQVQTGLETDWIYSEWYVTSIRSIATCPPTDEASGASAPPADVLLPGDYTVAWGGEWYGFTIPSGAEVSLTRGAVGEQAAMVFSVSGGAEVAVIPARVATNPPTSDNATLAAIVASFRAETDPAKLPAGAERRTCADSPLRANAGALSLDLDAQWCSVVSSGGAVTVSYGDERLSLTVPADRTWLIFSAPQSESVDAAGIWVMDRQTKAYLIFNPADAAELARHAPADAEGLSALLDAIVASASAPAATE